MQYFKHFTKMRSDTKIRRLFAKYGLEGYGLYNLIIESIAGSIETDSPLPFLEETCDDLACFYNANSAKIDEMVRFMIQEGLLSVETTENKVACFKIYAYLEQSQTRSEKIRELIAAYKDSKDILDRHKCLGQSETKVIEKNRKEEEKNKKAPFIPPTLEEAEEYILDKQLVINPSKFIDWYSKTDWKDKDGKQVKNWKNKLLSWDVREKDKNPDAVPYSKPKQYKPMPARLCPTCSNPLTGLFCKRCMIQYDENLKELL